VGHQLVALLGGGVERYGVVHIVAGREGHLLVQSVDAAGAGVHQVLDLLVAAAFQDIAEPDDVALHVGAGVLDAVAHAGLRSQVHDVGKLVGPEQVLQRRQVCDFFLDEVVVGVFRALDQLPVGHRVARDARFFQARNLQTDVVVVVDAVQPHDFVARRYQPVGEVEADEAGGAGEEDFHFGCFLTTEGTIFFRHKSTKGTKLTQNNFSGI